VRLNSSQECAAWASLALLFTTGVFAQTRSADAPPKGEILGEVIVTGSRLQVAATAANAPVTVLTREDLERAGADSLGDVLQALPMDTGTSLNPNVDASLGATRVDLRGLGSERTLVLLNGRRLPNGGVGGDASVDLNTLPVSMIERVEVLASGASAVHGSDAIGGVVNVITRRAHEGAELAGSWGITEEGDGQTVRGNAALGFDLLGGAWSLGLDYVRQDGVTDDRRSYSAQPMRIIGSAGTLGYVGQLGIPDGQFQVPAGNALGLQPGRYMRVPGATGQTAADYRPFTVADSYNVGHFNYSQTPIERRSAWLLGSQPLGESTRFFLEGLVHRRESAQYGAPEQYVPLSDPSPTLANGTKGIPAQNYYNPFGVDLPFAARRFEERGRRSVDEEIDLWRAVIGLEGTLGAWDWEVAAGTAESDATTRSAAVFAVTRYVETLGPSGPDDSGRIVCGARDPATGRVPAANVIPGCVPLNIFGGAGTVTQEQLDYMSPRTIVDKGTNDQRLAEAVLKGRWGQVLERDVHWAFGGEYRREAGSLVGDPLRNDSDFQGLIEPSLQGGSFDAKELFVEVNVPLWHDRAGARDVALDVGVRWSDFSSFGHNTAWQAGLHWQPLEEVTLRANYATVFHAPSLLDLFESRTVEPEFALDPCGNNPTPHQQVNCAADGVPGGAYVQSDAQLGVIRGGNPALGPETGKTYGMGVIYTPAWARGLTASLDFYAIELERVVGSDDLETVLVDCAQRGTAESCDAIRRFPDGSVSLVAGVNRNLGQRKVRGLDLAIDWDTVTRVGNLSARLLATYLERWDERPFSGGALIHHARWFDGGALPRWRASGHIDWRRGPWLASYAVEYIGSMTEDVLEFPPLRIFFAPYTRRIAPVFFHDIEAGYDFPHGLGLRAAITNVTDEDPPFVNTGLPENTDPGSYRLLGRTYFIQLLYRF